MECKEITIEDLRLTRDTYTSLKQALLEQNVALPEKDRH